MAELETVITDVRCTAQTASGDLYLHRDDLVRAFLKANRPDIAQILARVEYPSNEGKS